MLSVSQTTVDEDVGTVTINAVGTLAPPATLPGDVPVTLTFSGNAGIHY